MAFSYTEAASDGSTVFLRTTRDRDHPFRGIVITCFAHRDHLFRAS
jgi:hypothetical protein